MSVKRINEICTKGTSNLKQKDVEGENGIYPVYGASGLISKVDFYQQENEYIAIVKDGSGIGRVTFLPPKSSVIGTMQYILPIKGFDIKYVCYCLQSLDLTKYKQGAAIPHIYFRDYGERLVNVTEDSKEQERIVKILDAAFEKIGRLKENAEKGLQEVKNLWQATVTRIFSNLNDTIKLSNVAKISSGFAFKSNVFKKDGKYQILRIGNVKQGKVLYNSSPIFIDEMNSAELKKAELLINDLVITQTGTKNKRDYGFVSLIQRKNLLLNQRVAKVRVVDPNFLPKFFLYYSYTENYKTQYFSNEGGTVGQGNVGISALTDMLVPYPDIEEQKKVVETLDKIQNICQNIQSKYEQELSEYEALKQSILRKAFSGEL